ncbi:MAG TPA: FAD-binding oxidoreductase [Solirubrobacteraceae bacterium]|nr:FAD-binding oxidoreductase [Solirubrobacteraceae bacterium]
MTGVAVDQLKEGFAGAVVRPGDGEYDSLRAVFNGMIDRLPAVIARCTGVGDVVTAVNYARERGLPLAVYGGGHGVTGHAVCDRGLVIDLRPMKEVRIDAHGAAARVAPGVTWGELDAATQEFGLAVTGGRVSTTGVAGLTLGSGSGWLERKLGLTADNLLSAEVVLADGTLVTASEWEHDDLFWALRGGGGSFGIVTEFEFQLHPVGPVVLGGLVLHSADRAPELLRFFRAFMADAPDEVGGAVGLITAPPQPFVPSWLRGRPTAAIIACYAGDVKEGARVLAPLRDYGPPAADLVQRIPYTALQRLVDEANRPGLRNHWGGEFLVELSDEAIEVFCSAHARAPSPHTQILIVPGGGQIARVPEGATAIGQRQAPWNTHLLAMWEDAGDDARNLAWLRELQSACAPYTTGRAWLNFVGEEGETRVRRALGEETYEQLQAVKERYDRRNLFRLNQNIRPSEYARRRV